MHKYDISEPCYTWYKEAKLSLATFVQPENLPDEFRLDRDVHPHDLVQKEGIAALAEMMYGQIRDLKINYAPPPSHEEPEVYQQRIRKPVTILNENQATCLDLAVLFAAMCLDNNVLPIIVGVEGHAFIGFSLEETRDKRKTSSGWDNGMLTKLSTLQEFVRDQRVMLLECTGAVKVTSFDPGLPEAYKGM
jgi:hypothetical protein